MSSSLAARIVLALVVAVGFYALALGAAAGLLFLVYAQVAIWDVFNIRLSIAAIVGAAIILWSILPRPDRFEPPGPALTAARHPDLFAEIERVSTDVRQPMPHDVYLIPDVNAFVTTRGGFIGIGSKRVMGIGLALMASLTITQLRAARRQKSARRKTYPASQARRARSSRPFRAGAAGSRSVPLRFDAPIAVHP